MNTQEPTNLLEFDSLISRMEAKSLAFSSKGDAHATMVMDGQILLYKRKRNKFLTTTQNV